MALIIIGRPERRQRQRVSGSQTTTTVGGRSRRTGQLLPHTPVLLLFCYILCRVCSQPSTTTHWPEEETTRLLLKKQLIYHPSLLASPTAAVVILARVRATIVHHAQLPIHLSRPRTYQRSGEAKKIIGRSHRSIILRRHDMQRQHGTQRSKKTKEGTEK